MFGFTSNKHSMNKQDIAEKVHGVLGTTKADAERAVETVVETIVGALRKGDEVSIAGLGIFKTKMRAARTARNPRTGETVQVPTMRVPKFQPAKALKEAVK
jgi:DNA-binding protein HU-beta